MAVKSLILISRGFFLILTDNKHISVNCKSVSVMTGPHSFLLQPNTFWLVVFSSKYLLFTSALNSC